MDIKVNKRFLFSGLMFLQLLINVNIVSAQSEVYSVVQIYSDVSASFGYNGNLILSGVNNSRQVTGYTTVNSNSIFRAFRWDQGSVVNLGQLSSQNVNAWDINNSGEVVGTARSGNFFTYIWNGSMSIKHINPNASGPVAINNLSQYADGGGVWEGPTKVHSLPSLTPGYVVYTHAINDLATVVGDTFLTVGSQPVYWKNNQIYRLLPNLTTEGTAYDINNHNQIVGYYYPDRGFLWENGSVTQTFAGRAIAINDNGVVLVNTTGSENTVAIWDSVNGLQNLNDLVPDLPLGFQAVDINDNGDIIGQVGRNSAYLLVRVEVSNTAPTLTPINPQTTTEGTELTFTLSATDEDDDQVAYSATNLPSGAALDPQTGLFTWTPDFNDAGSYEVIFTATEDTLEALSDSETVTISVINFNRPPELTAIGNQTVSEGDTLQFMVTATDQDGDDVTLSAVNLPADASFTPSTGLFSWNTTYTDAGNYENIEFTATDNGTPMELDVELITITVGDVNRAPDITNLGPQEVLEEETVLFNILATDPDGDNITITTSNLPAGATFNGSTFSWTPYLSDEGVYLVTFTATDTGTPTESASIDVVITVGDNPTPVEQAEDLIEIVVTIDIPQNVENSYLANLQKVGQFIAEGKITAALNQLNAFKNKLQQDYQQGILTQAEYEQLMDAANALIADLNN